MTQEEIFRSSAARNMIQFDLESFKKTHPKLYKTIQEAQQESFKEGVIKGANLSVDQSLKYSLSSKQRKN